MALADTVYDIGSPSHKLAMRSLKPLSGLGGGAYNEFWPAWTTINAHRRAEIAHAMVELAEDNVDLDFAQALVWLLGDDDAEVRAAAAEGLWESERSVVLEGLVKALQSDPAASVSTFRTEATDLHDLLHTIGESGPYVMVGHSFGGAEAVTFASQYPISQRTDGSAASGSLARSQSRGVTPACFISLVSSARLQPVSRNGTISGAIPAASMRPSAVREVPHLGL